MPIKHAGQHWCFVWPPWVSCYSPGPRCSLSADGESSMAPHHWRPGEVPLIPCLATAASLPSTPCLAALSSLKQASSFSLISRLLLKACCLVDQDQEYTFLPKRAWAGPGTQAPISSSAQHTHLFKVPWWFSHRLSKKSTNVWTILLPIVTIWT